MLVLGPIVGVLSGTLSYWIQYWIDPTIITRPIGQYRGVLLYNILAWTSWLLFFPLIWRLASAVRIRRERFVPPTAFHVALSFVIAALVCGVAGVIGLVTGTSLLMCEMWLALNFLQAEVELSEGIQVNPIL